MTTITKALNVVLAQVSSRASRARRRSLALGMSATVALSTLGVAIAAPANSAPSDQASSTLKVQFFASGFGGLKKPDDVAVLGTDLFVAYQNGVGATGGAASGTGTTTSTIVEYAGKSVKAQWVVTGKCDGLGADAATGQIIASVNEDGNSSLYTIDVASGVVTHFTYNVDPASSAIGGGGTDAISVVNGKILISASAPNSATAPAVFSVALDASTKIATLTPFFSDNASATGPNGAVTLALTDPDSNAVVPSSSPLYAGDFALNSQGDSQMIFASNPASATPTLSVLTLGTQIDDFTWATSTEGSLILTDNSANTIYQITGDFTPGTVFVDTASDSGVPGIVGTLNLATGQVTPLLVGFTNPHGLIFVPSSR
ncbi:MAG TPA: hypothetical protein VIC81_01965 [Acidimicrobiales bacterium]|jgi:hypothetical protein